MLKNLKFWLMVSLAVNFLFVGLFIGGAWHAHKSKDAKPPMNEIGAILRAMPKERQREIRENLATFVSPWRGEAAGEMEALMAAIASDPFARAELAQILESNRQRNCDIAERSHAFIIEKIDEMPLTERQVMTENMRELMQRFDHDQHMQGGKPPRHGGSHGN